jgi:hypothetical protein
MADRSFVAVLLLMLAGALIWSIHFTIIYGFTSVACARGLADNEVLGMDLVRLTVIVATGVAALAVLLVVVRSLRDSDGRSAEEIEPPSGSSSAGSQRQWPGWHWCSS